MPLFGLSSLSRRADSLSASQAVNGINGGRDEQYRIAEEQALVRHASHVVRERETDETVHSRSQDRSAFPPPPQPPVPAAQPDAQPAAQPDATPAAKVEDAAAATASMDVEAQA